jgi:uncharacterized protein YciI
MDKKHFFVKLNAPRATYAVDMTAEEKQIMQEHIAYWKPYSDNGTMIVFGPVLNPAGVFGIGILEVESEEALQQLLSNDPALKAGNKYEFYPMRAVIFKGIINSREVGEKSNFHPAD